MTIILHSRRTTIILGWVFTLVNAGLSFVPSRSDVTWPHTKTYGGTLFAKRHWSSSGKSSQKKKQKKSKNKHSLSKSVPKAKSMLPSSTMRGPPWQVMSKKDADANVEHEKERRQLIKEGVNKKASASTRSKLQATLTKALLTEADATLLKWKRFNPKKSSVLELELVSSQNIKMPPRLGLPEVCFLGRSNVGKSSLLNALCGTNDGARVSKTPGATASVNLYVLKNPKFLLGMTDLPGFGHAKISKQQQEEVQRSAEYYLRNRKELALGILLVDIRREPSLEDCAVLAALYDQNVPLVVVATKADKLGEKELKEQLEIINRKLGLPLGQPLCVSSVTGQNVQRLWQIVLDACEDRIMELEQELLSVPSEMENESPSILLDQIDNDEEIHYNQGYDWIHGSNVMYEDEDEESLHEDGQEGEGWEDRHLEQHDAFKLKNLEKRVKYMQQRGEI